jgi:integrase
MQLIVTINDTRYTRSVHGHSLREAKTDLLPRFIVEIRSGVVAEAKAAALKASEAPTFNVAVEQFLEREFPRRGHDRAATGLAYGSLLRRVGKTLGEKRVSLITKHDIRGRLLAINAEATAKTIALCHVALSRLFRRLTDDEVIADSPVLPLGKLKLPAAGREAKQRGALTPEQVGSLLDACGEHHDLRLWIEIMVGTGMRPGEALALTWGAIDFRRCCVHVQHTAKQEGGRRGAGMLGSPKTKKSRRVVPLAPNLAASLQRAYVARQVDLQALGLTLEPGDCVFPADLIDARGAPKVPLAFRRKFRSACRLAGLSDDVSAHWLRHTVATTALAGTENSPGISIVDAADLLGNSPAMIAKVYGHAVGANLARGVALADAFLGPRTEPAANVVELPRKSA